VKYLISIELLLWNRCSVVSIVAWLGAGRSEVQEIFLFESAIPTLGPPSLLFSGYQSSLARGEGGLGGRVVVA